jgi:16S rRNA A1518/A1519 N6-dimethyltransferase RsmA/KsgA/DIM1 with predicted DNA glycosylase/AP lyase activity
MTLMFAEGMGRRFLPDFSKRTRFSTLTQTAFDVSLVDTYDKACFNPQPAADVICLGFASRKRRLFDGDQDFENYTTFLRKIYTLPNKQILRAVVNGYKKDGIQAEFILECLKKLEISSTERVFSTPIHKLLALSRLIEKGPKVDYLLGQ